jgi:hypothetical protein
MEAKDTRVLHYFAFWGGGRGANPISQALHRLPGLASLCASYRHEGIFNAPFVCAQPPEMAEFAAMPQPPRGDAQVVGEWKGSPGSNLVWFMALLTPPSEAPGDEGTPHPRRLATAGHKSLHIHVWDLETHAMLAQLSAGEDATHGFRSLVAYEASGASRLAAGFGQGSVTLFDGHSYERVSSASYVSGSPDYLTAWVDPTTGAALLIASDGQGLAVRIIHLLL